MSDAIDRYLDELSRRLPADSKRLVHEAEDHLHEARDRFVAAGLSPEAAEERAVAEYGTIEDVTAAVSEMGGPLISPPVRRTASLVAFLLTLPTLVFVSVNVIEQLAGNDGGIGVFGSTFDNYQEQINVLLTLGPLVALLLVVMTSVRIRLASVGSRYEATIQFHLTRWMIAVGVIAILVAVGVFAYLLSENVFCIPGSWEIC